VAADDHGDGRLPACGGRGGAGDDVGQAAGTAVHAALQDGAVASGEDRGQQIGDGVGLGERVADMLQQRVGDGGWLFGQA